MNNAGNHFSLNMRTVRKPRRTLFHSRNKVSQQAQANSGSLHSPQLAFCLGAGQLVAAFASGDWLCTIMSIIFVPQ